MGRLPGAMISIRLQVSVRRSSPSTLLIASVLVLLAGAGCAPGCERTCKKVLKCEGLDADRVALEECETSCQTQLIMYDGWRDEDALEQAFTRHRRCIGTSTCEEIAAGECYEDRLFQLGDGHDTGSIDTDTSPAE